MFPSEHMYTVLLSFREGRLRHYLGVRYDARSGVFDWDYNMKLVEMVCLAHHAVMYVKWDINSHHGSCFLHTN